MALDEPKDDDNQFEAAGLTFLVSPSVLKMVESLGPVLIDYRDYPWGGQIVIKASGAAAC